jgi:uncharacterized protein (TIGR03437 family)
MAPPLLANQGGQIRQAMAIKCLALPRGTLPRRSDTALVAFVAAALFLVAGPVTASVPPPFSTFLQENVTLQGIGHDAAGDIFVLGGVNDSPIPGHGSDLVVARLDASATKVVYFVYLGGSGDDQGRALAVDQQGNAYITGYTESSDFPVTSGFSGPVPSGSVYPFLIKLNPNGSVAYATLFAGALAATPSAIAVDNGGNIFISGTAVQGYPPTPGAFSSGMTGTNLPFIAKLDPSGTKTLFAVSGVGGSQIALGPQGDIWVSGNIAYLAYPTTPGAYQTTFTPSFSCGSMPGAMCSPASQQYITRLSADGTKLIYSTYLTGASGSTNLGLAVDSAGNAYVTGTTTSQDYPFTTAPSASDRPGLFLTKLDVTGSKVLWSVMQGGNLLALDAGGNPVVGGSSGPLYTPSGTAYPPPPPTGNTPAQCLPNRTTVQSVAHVQGFRAQDGSTAATQLLSATEAYAYAMAVEPDGRILLGGRTELPDVPLSPGVVFSEAVTQRTVPGAFLAAFDLSQPASGPQLGCVTDAVTLAPIGPAAPGQLLSLFGAGLGPQTGISGFAAGQTSLPTSLANVQVTFDGLPAPLLYVSSGQINVQVPFEVAQNASTVMTVSIGPDSVTRIFAVVRSSPSVFLDMSVSVAGCDPSYTGDVVFAAVALNSDGSRNSCANPAKPGTSVTIFLNGVAAKLGSSFAATGSITGLSQDPFGSQVDVRSDLVSLAAGRLFPAPGMIAGISQLSVQLPEIGEPGLQLVSLGVAIDGIRAFPLAVYNGTLYQTAVLVWVKQ